MSVRFLLLFLLGSLIVVLSGCKTTSYKTFEGGKTLQGVGGTKEVLNGIDIWNFGTPPYKYKIIGVIEDERPGGRLHLKTLYADAVTKAIEVGGDAIIVETNDNKVTGSFNTGAQGFIVGNTVFTGASQSYAIKRNYSRFLVVKYLP